MEEKAEIINNLLEEKNITIQDEYFHDAFINENNVEIFRFPSAKTWDNETEGLSVMDEIILKLSSYENES